MIRAGRSAGDLDLFDVVDFVHAARGGGGRVVLVEHVRQRLRVVRVFDDEIEIVDQRRGGEVIAEEDDFRIGPDQDDAEVAG